MSGLTPISSQFSGLASVFQARANIPALLRAQNTFRTASAVIADPPQSLAVNTALRDLRRQRGGVQADLNENTEFQTRLQQLLTGLNNINTGLTNIKALVDATIATPGNAGINQAAIDTIVASVQNQVLALRNIEPNAPTFLLAGVDARISDLALFSADGSRIDTNGINVDINITNDARRAEIFTFLSDYYLTDALTNIRVRGPGGDSATINLQPAGSTINAAIRNVDRNNTEAVTFEVFGGNHLGTAVNHTAPQLISTVAGTVAEIQDAIVGINELLNYGDTTLSITTETSNGARNFVIDGGTQAVIANAVTNINTIFNSGSGSFQVGNVDGGGALQTINFDGGTQGTAASVITGDAAAINTGATVVRVIGFGGTQDISLSGGDQAQRISAISNLTARRLFNDGATTITVTGNTGTSGNVGIAAGTQAVSANSIGNLGGNTGGFDSTLTLQVVHSGGTTSDTITLETDETNIGNAIAQLNASIGGSSLNGLVLAEQNGTSIRFRTVEFGSGTRVQVTAVNNQTTGGLTMTSTANAAGTAPGTGLTNYRDTIINAINTVTGASGVQAFATGNDVSLRSTTAGGVATFGSGTSVKLNFVGGDNQGFNTTAATGTAGLTAAQAVTAINAQANTTKVFATLNVGNIDIKASLDGAGTNAFGSGADVSLQFFSGGNAFTVPGGTGNGNAGDTQGDVIDAINAVTGAARVVASDNFGNIRIVATDNAGNNVFGSNSNVQVVNNATSNTAGIDFLFANNADVNGNIGDTRDDVINTINALRYNGGVNPTGVIATAGGAANSITLTTSSVGTTDIGQFDDDGVAGTGNIEQITVANVTLPGPTPVAQVGATTNDSGTNSTSRAQLITLINAVTGATAVQATASGTYNITLTSTKLGLGADVNLRPVTNPETTAYAAGSVFPNPAAVNNEDITFYRASGAQLAAGNREVQYGTVLGISGVNTGDGDNPNATTFTMIRDEALLRINTAANPIGVEAFIHDSSNGPTDPAVTNDNAFSLSLRSFLFGGAFRVDVDTGGGVTGAGGLNHDTDTVLTNPFDIGEHAVATVVVDGSTAQTLTSTNPGNNPATLSGGNFAFGENGVSVNQFSFNVNGVIGQFSAPVDLIFDPAAVTAVQDTSLFLPLVDAQNNFLTRFNFTSLDANFLGDFVFDRSNIETRGRDGAQGPEVPRGGLKDIDVTTSTLVGTAIVDQAIAEVAQDINTATNLLNNLVSPLVDTAEALDASIETQISGLTAYNQAISDAAELAANEQITNTSSVLAQLSLLFPAATLPLLRGLS